MTIDSLKERMSRMGTPLILALTLLLSACPEQVIPTKGETSKPTPKPTPVDTSPRNLDKFYSNIPSLSTGQCVDISLGHKTRTKANEALSDLKNAIAELDRFILINESDVFRYTGKDLRSYYAAYILFQCEGVALRVTTFAPIPVSRKEEFKAEISKELEAQGFVVWGFDEELYGRDHVIITVIYYKDSSNNREENRNLRTASVISSSTNTKEEVDDFMADPDNQDLFDVIRETHVERFLEDLEDLE